MLGVKSRTYLPLVPQFYHSFSCFFICHEFVEALNRLSAPFYSGDVIRGYLDLEATKNTGAVSIQGLKVRISASVALILFVLCLLWNAKLNYRSSL